MSKLPAFQFYPGDWRKDPGVQSLGYHDRGVWFEILCLMHESEVRGKLMLNGQPMPEDALARLLGLDKQILTTTLTTLLTYGVASTCEESGSLICRRMIRDEYLREIRQSAGKKGGNPALLKQNPTTMDKQNPTPSSSSSSSFSSSEIKEEEPAKQKKKRTPSDPSKAKGTIEELESFAKEIGIQSSDGEYAFYKWEGTSWKVGGNPIKDWRATMRSWKAGGYFPSQKANNQTKPTHAETRKAAAAEIDIGYRQPNQTVKVQSSMPL